MHPAKYFLGACGLLLGIGGCWKSIEKTNTRSISGIVRDEVKQKNLPFAKLYLYGARASLNEVQYSEGPLDSITADNAGKFSFQFEPMGDFIDYGLRLGEIVYGGFNYGNESNYVIDFKEPIYKCNYRKNIADAIVKARELNYTKIQLKVISNPFDSFYVRAYTFGFRRPVLVIGQSIDTTIIIRHLPNEWNVFQFYTEALRDTAGLVALNSDPNPNSRKYTIRRMVADSLFVDLRDTFVVAKVISSSLNMPRQ